MNNEKIQQIPKDRDSGNKTRAGGDYTNQTAVMDADASVSAGMISKSRLDRSPQQVNRSQDSTAKNAFRRGTKGKDGRYYDRDS